MLVRRTSSVAGDESGNGHGNRPTAHARPASPPLRDAPRLGVTCRLGATRLQALRARLMEGLRLLGLALVPVSDELVLLWSDLAWLGPS